MGTQSSWGFSPRGNIQLRTLHSTYSKRATSSTMRQLSLLLLLSVAMLCSASTLRVKRDAQSYDFISRPAVSPSAQTSASFLDGHEQADHVLGLDHVVLIDLELPC